MSAERKAYHRLIRHTEATVVVPQDAEVVPFTTDRYLEQASRAKVAHIAEDPLFHVSPISSSEFSAWGDRPDGLNGWGIESPAELLTVLEQLHTQAGAKGGEWNEVWAKLHILNPDAYRASGQMKLHSEGPYTFSLRLIEGFGVDGVVDRNAAAKRLRQLMNQVANDVLEVASFHLGRLTDTPSDTLLQTPKDAQK